MHNITTRTVSNGFFIRVNTTQTQTSQNEGAQTTPFAADDEM